VREEGQNTTELPALAEAITVYEADHGDISTEEMAAQERRDREAAVVVRGRSQA
jgi:hypothetical protein